MYSVGDEWDVVGETTSNGMVYTLRYNAYHIPLPAEEALGRYVAIAQTVPSSKSSKSSNNRSVEW